MTNWHQPDCSDPPVGQLSPQDWLDDPASHSIFAALNRQGGEVRFVGGCVRDGLLNRSVTDLDLATTHPPERTMALLAQAGIRVIPTGLEHGTVTAVAGNRTYQITTLRRDVNTDGRHAQVDFTKSWRDDAARRDFTINTMSANLKGQIWDPLEGIQHLSMHWVGFVGNPETRIKEDFLRILRFFRFNAYYGTGVPDKNGLDACRKLAPRLVELSAERIRDEVHKLLAAPDPSPVVTVMCVEGIFTPILPAIQHPDRLKVLVWLESRALARPQVVPDPLRRLACLLPPDRATALEVGQRLRLTKAQTQRLGAIAAGWNRTGPDIPPQEFRRLLHRVGPQIMQDRVLLAWAEQRRISEGLTSAATARWVDLLDRIDQWQPVAFPLRGQDLLDLGYAPGPALGELLDQVELWWEDQDYLPDHSACLAQLRTLTPPVQAG